MEDDPQPTPGVFQSIGILGVAPGMGLDGQGKTTRDAVVKQRAMLENITPDENKKALGSKRSTYCSRRIDGYGKTSYFNLDWIDVLLRGGVRCRCDHRHVNDGQPEPLGGLLIYTGPGRACVDQGKARFWGW